MVDCQLGDREGAEGFGQWLEESQAALEELGDQLQAAGRQVQTLRRRFGCPAVAPDRVLAAKGAENAGAEAVRAMRAAAVVPSRLRLPEIVRAIGEERKASCEEHKASREQLGGLREDPAACIRTPHAEEEPARAARLAQLLSRFGSAATEAEGPAERFRGDAPVRSGPPSRYRRQGSMDSEDCSHLGVRAELETVRTMGSNRKQLTSRGTLSVMPPTWLERCRETCSAVRQWDRRKVLETVSGTLIVLSIIWMAIDVDMGMRSLAENSGMPDWVVVGDSIFTACFTIELVARLAVYRRECCSSAELPWNILNFVIVGTDLLDLFVRMYSPSILRSLRVTRIVRILRVVRAMRAIRELRVMLTSIFCCFLSMTWALVLLLLVMLMTAMILMETMLFRLDPASSHAKDPLLLKYFGSLGSSMLSICMAVTGGVSWEDLMVPLEPISAWYPVAWAVYMAFFTVGLMNVLAAIFVESTSRIAEVDSDLAISEQYDRERADCKMIRQFFEEADAGKTGFITKEQFEGKMEDARCSAQLQTLKLDAWTVKGMFRLLCIGSSGVEIESLVYGLMRLRGSARAIDMAMLLHDGKRSSARLRSQLRGVQCELEGVKEILGLSRAIQALADGGAEWTESSASQALARVREAAWGRAAAFSAGGDTEWAESSASQALPSVREAPGAVDGSADPAAPKSTLCL